MKTTLNADQLIQCLLKLETTQVFEHPAHPTHPLLLGGVYRVVETKITALHYTGKVLVVSYSEDNFGYEQEDAYGRQLRVNYSQKRSFELKPTAAVKRQLEKFVGRDFECVAELKSVLLDEVLVDQPGAEVMSAAGVVDALSKNTSLPSGGTYRIEQEDGTWLVERYKIQVMAAKIEYSKGVLHVKKSYYEQFENGRQAFIDVSEKDMYEQVVLVPSAQVRTILRAAGFVGYYSWNYESEEFTDLLAAQARLDKLNLLRA